MMPLARRIQKDTKRLDSDKLIERMKKLVAGELLTGLVYFNLV